MENVNVVRYSHVLGLSNKETVELLKKLVKTFPEVILKRTKSLSLTEKGLAVYGIPFEQYRTIWFCDREEIIDQDYQRALVKLLNIELSNFKVELGKDIVQQLDILRSMNTQDMVRAGLWDNEQRLK